MTDLAPPDLVTVPQPRSEVRMAKPSAMVAVMAPRGTARRIASCLAALSLSEGLAGLRIRPGSLAVLVLSADEGGETEVEAVAPDYGFPLRAERHPDPDPREVAARAAEWAATLGIPDAPILVLDARHRVAPNWAYAALAAIRDGADVVRGRCGLGRRLGWGAPSPLAVRSASLIGEPPERLGHGAI
ncbi:hypothetical protein [Muricoccus radiodurans]|uniref:hypothetical protein n=1 Tax=Muricoccus radiodurans TaxID=2231721 RepID=UPI003CE87950